MHHVNDTGRTDHTISADMSVKHADEAEQRDSAPDAVLPPRSLNRPDCLV